MAIRYYDLEGDGTQIGVEILDDKSVLFPELDEKAELAAQAIGFEPSIQWSIAKVM